MKALLIASLLAVSVPAFSGSIFSKKTIEVSGLRARALMDIGNQTDSTEGSMGGKSDMDLTNVKCEKIVDDKNDQYVQRCSFTAFEKEVKISSADEDNRQTSEDLRSALNEIVKNEKQVSDVKKTIEVKEIKCHGAGYGHGLDSLEIEPTYKCSITK